MCESGLPAILSHSMFKQVNTLNHTKKYPATRTGYCFIKSLAVTYFHMGNPTLSSALSSFTSEFGMGSGGSHSLWPPGKLVERFMTSHSGHVLQ